MEVTAEMQGNLDFSWISLILTTCLRKLPFGNFHVLSSKIHVLSLQLLSTLPFDFHSTSIRKPFWKLIFRLGVIWKSNGSF